MPKPIIPIGTPQREQDWLLLRQGLRRLIEHVAPKAKVFERWPLKFDAGQTAELLKSPADGGRIHSWIIGIHRAIPLENAIGGSALNWDLTVRIWGFIGYEHGIDSENPQNEIELEAKRVTQIIYLNREHLTLDNTQALHKVGLLEFRDIDAQGFGRDDIIVAQGELKIRLNEVL
jgi:hypothetical protein